MNPLHDLPVRSCTSFTSLTATSIGHTGNTAACPVTHRLIIGGVTGQAAQPLRHGEQGAASPYRSNWRGIGDGHGAPVRAALSADTGRRRILDLAVARLKRWAHRRSARPGHKCPAHDDDAGGQAGPFCGGRRPYPPSPPPPHQVIFLSRTEHVQATRFPSPFYGLCPAPTLPPTRSLFAAPTRPTRASQALSTPAHNLIPQRRGHR